MTFEAGMDQAPVETISSRSSSSSSSSSCWQADWWWVRVWAFLWD